MSIYARPEATVEASLEDAPSGIAGATIGTAPNDIGPIGVQVINPPAGTVMTARTTAGIVEQPAGSGIYHVSLTAPVGLDTYSIVWDTGGTNPNYASEDLVVSGYAYPTSQFATMADVRARCGTEAEDEQIEFLLDAATALILAAIGRDLDWLADVDSVIPTILRFVCTEMVCRALGSSPGIQSTTESESLGEYSVSNTDRYEGGYGGIWLTDEERRILRGLFGYGSGSSRLESIVTDLAGAELP